MTTDHPGTALARTIDRPRTNRSGHGPSASRERRPANPVPTADEIADEATPGCVSALLLTGIRSLLAERGADASGATERTPLGDGSMLSAGEVSELVARLEIALERGYGLRLDLGIAGRSRTVATLARHVSRLALQAGAAPRVHGRMLGVAQLG
jgi:hypothetical protein